MTLPRFYTTEEVADALRVCVEHLYDLVRAGVVTPMRVGRNGKGPMRWTDADVQALVNYLTPAAAMVVWPIRRRSRRKRRAA